MASTFLCLKKYVILLMVIFMHFKVSIEQFDGPLDLMLHLIKENKLDLFDLDMNVLATQYIQFIKDMQSMHLEVASEYLVELASLVEYKSKKLLPRESVEVEESYEEDTRQQLVDRLLEYQRFKEASEILKEEYENRQRHFSREPASLIDQWAVIKESDELEPQSPYELMKAMKRVLARHAILQPYETNVTIKELSVEERIEQVKDKIEHHKDMMSFEDLCLDCINLHMIIVTFLSILDLIHKKWIDYSLDENDRIWIKRSSV